MREPIEVAELPEFDAAASLSDARAAAAYLADIAQAEDEGLLSAGLADIERAGVLDEVARAAGVAPQRLASCYSPTTRSARKRSNACSRPQAFAPAKPQTHAARPPRCEPAERPRASPLNPL
jgi:DNA-binding phage protein